MSLWFDRMFVIDAFRWSHVRYKWDGSLISSDNDTLEISDVHKKEMGRSENNKFDIGIVWVKWINCVEICLLLGNSLVDVHC